MIRQKNSFDGCFEVFWADTPESKQIYHRLGKQIYAEETGLEDFGHFSNYHPYAEDDQDTVCFLVRHTRSGRWLGALRLNIQKASAFRFQRHYFSDRKPLLSDSYYAEISRLWIVRDAKRIALAHSMPGSFKVDASSWSIDFSNELTNFNKNLMWGLYRAAAIYSTEHGVKYWQMPLNPALASCFAKEGFNLQEMVASSGFGTRLDLYRLAVDEALRNPFWLNEFKNDVRPYSVLAGEFAHEFKRRQLRTIGMISLVPRV